MPPKDKPEIKTASLRMPTTVWDLLNKLCEEQKRTQAAVVEILVTDAAKKSGIKPDKK